MKFLFYFISIFISLQLLAAEQSLDKIKNEFVIELKKDAEQKKLDIDQYLIKSIGEIQNTESCSQLQDVIWSINHSSLYSVKCVDLIVADNSENSEKPEEIVADNSEKPENNELLYGGVNLVLALAAIVFLLILILIFKIISKYIMTSRKIDGDVQKSSSKEIENFDEKSAHRNKRGDCDNKKNQHVPPRSHNIQKSENSEKAITQQLSNKEKFTSPIASSDNEQLSSIPKTEQDAQKSPLIINEWRIFHESIQGLDHSKKTPEIPCQDSKYLTANDEVIIAIVCDGAGSHQYSHIGSNIYSKILNDTTLNLLDQVKDKRVSLNDEQQWRLCAKWIFKTAYFDYKSQIQGEKTKIPDITTANSGCTAILMVIFNDFLLCAHVGDGRAGYTINGEEWFSCMTPWKGEYSNSSVFIHEERIYQSNFENLLDENNPFLETRVIKNSVRGFCLLSDGVENGIWETVVRDDKSEINTVVNKPFSIAINQIVGLLNSELEKTLAISNGGRRNNNDSMQSIQDLFAKILIEGNEKLKIESDDKTLVLGYKKS